MSEISVEEANDFVLDCYNLRKKLKEVDNTVWEPAMVSGIGIFSVIDGRKMTEEEFLKKWPPGTWPDIRKSS